MILFKEFRFEAEIETIKKMHSLSFYIDTIMTLCILVDRIFFTIIANFEYVLFIVLV
jgi:hypothetical protein